MNLRENWNNYGIKSKCNIQIQYLGQIFTHSHLSILCNTFCRGPEEAELPSAAPLSSGLWSLEEHQRKVGPLPPAAYQVRKKSSKEMTTTFFRVVTGHSVFSHLAVFSPSNLQVLFQQQLTYNFGTHSPYWACEVKLANVSDILSTTHIKRIRKINQNYYSFW